MIHILNASEIGAYDFRATAPATPTAPHRSQPRHASTIAALFDESETPIPASADQVLR
jgi:hypothetical protein